MRFSAVLAVAFAFGFSSSADARLFWQTYGSTVPGPAGAGCAWNLNSDYFVPRSCDSCRYGLFSPCKTAHTLSPACKNLHPVYKGYCTVYGSCHYMWRDHVYQKRCGCEPLRSYYGPWHLKKCRKHAFVLRPHGPCETGGACAGETCGTGVEGAPYIDYQRGFAPVDPRFIPPYAWLPNVESIGGETLGTVDALPIGSLSAGRAAAGALPAAGGAGPGAMPAPTQNGLQQTFPTLFGN